MQFKHMIIGILFGFRYWGKGFMSCLNIGALATCRKTLFVPYTHMNLSGQRATFFGVVSIMFYLSDIPQLLQIAAGQVANYGMSSTVIMTVIISILISLVFDAWILSLILRGNSVNRRIFVMLVAILAVSSIIMGLWNIFDIIAINYGFEGNAKTVFFAAGILGNVMTVLTGVGCMDCLSKGEPMRPKTEEEQ